MSVHRDLSMGEQPVAKMIATPGFLSFLSLISENV